MEKALPYVISAGIIGFGVWILIAGLNARLMGMRGPDSHCDWAPERFRRLLDAHSCGHRAVTGTPPSAVPAGGIRLRAL
jgi:hypothetical protein